MIKDMIFALVDVPSFTGGIVTAVCGLALLNFCLKNLKRMIKAMIIIGFIVLLISVTGCSKSEHKLSIANETPQQNTLTLLPDGGITLTLNNNASAKQLIQLRGVIDGTQTLQAEQAEQAHAIAQQGIQLQQQQLDHKTGLTIYTTAMGVMIVLTALVCGTVIVVCVIMTRRVSV